MNKQKQEMEKRRVLNQIRHTSLSGNKSNTFNSYMSETESHIRKKFEVWLKLRKAGYQVWTEVIFNGGIRMDVLAFKDGIFTNYEILENETIEKFNEKIKNYPPEITVIPIKSNKEIENLEMF
jgi:hypothetical protein